MKQTIVTIGLITSIFFGSAYAETITVDSNIVELSPTEKIFRLHEEIMMKLLVDVKKLQKENKLLSKMLDDIQKKQDLTSVKILNNSSSSKEINTKYDKKFRAYLKEKRERGL